MQSGTFVATELRRAGYQDALDANGIVGAPSLILELPEPATAAEPSSPEEQHHEQRRVTDREVSESQQCQQ